MTSPADMADLTQFSRITSSRFGAVIATGEQLYRETYYMANHRSISLKIGDKEFDQEDSETRYFLVVHPEVRVSVNDKGQCEYSPIASVGGDVPPSLSSKRIQESLTRRLDIETQRYSQIVTALGSTKFSQACEALDEWCEHVSTAARGLRDELARQNADFDFDFLDRTWENKPALMKRWHVNPFDEDTERAIDFYKQPIILYPDEADTRVAHAPPVSTKIIASLIVKVRKGDGSLTVLPRRLVQRFSDEQVEIDFEARFQHHMTSGDPLFPCYHFDEAFQSNNAASIQKAILHHHDTTRDRGEQFLESVGGSSGTWDTDTLVSEDELPGQEAI